MAAGPDAGQGTGAGACVAVSFDSAPTGPGTDSDAAEDLMDHAADKTSQYLARHRYTPEQQPTAQIKCVIRRRARKACGRPQPRIAVWVDAR